MNYDNHNITTARINPYDKHEEEEFKEAEKKAETILRQIEKTAEKEDSNCQETAIRTLENIKHVKLYAETGGVTICLENAEEFCFYLLHGGYNPRTVDFEKNHIRF